MYSLLDFIDTNATTMLFNVAAITLFFTLARLLRVRPVLALAIAFTPLILAWAFGDAPSGQILAQWLHN